MRMTGLRKISLCRLIVGHTHFVVDQRHSVFARFLRGIIGRLGSCRKDFHSLSQFVEAAFRAHKDLREFVEIGKLFNFDDWLKPMRNRLEDGIQVRNQLLLLFIYHIFVVCSSETFCS